MSYFINSLRQTHRLGSLFTLLGWCPSTVRLTVLPTLECKSLRIHQTISSKYYLRPLSSLHSYAPQVLISLKPVDPLCQSIFMSRKLCPTFVFLSLLIMHGRFLHTLLTPKLHINELVLIFLPHKTSSRSSEHQHSCTLSYSTLVTQNHKFLTSKSSSSNWRRSVANLLSFSNRLIKFHPV